MAGGRRISKFVADIKYEARTPARELVLLANWARRQKDFDRIKKIEKGQKI